MPSFSYFTISTPSEGQYKEKGSKFLAFALPVVSDFEIKEQLITLRKKYFDARHHCYGWILGPDKEIFKAFDDGEPHHSAGDPILGQLRSKNLTNVLVVVVRYFGGVKLGVGGLIQAYKTAAEDALKNASIIVREVTINYRLSWQFQSTPEVMRLVKEFELRIIDQKFSEGGEMTIEIKIRDSDRFIEKVKLHQAMGSGITIEELR